LIGHAELPETKTDGKIARRLDRDDMVANTMGTFTSVTVHCAQCHNHKFDPISQEDYYSLQTVFSALDRADKKYFPDPAMTERFNQLEGRQREISERKRAIERDGGGSLKKLHKLIVMSATYRQSSTGNSGAGNPRALKVDANNTLLWRQNRRKLEAEAVRDSVLAVTGKLDLTGYAAHRPGSQELNALKISVEDGRPVSKAIETLEDKYGWIITYEDPRYVHNSEIVDVALKVRRDLDQYKPGEVPPVLVPKGGALEFTYLVEPGTNLPTDPARVVQNLLDAQNASGNAGRFRLETSPQIMHVIPTTMKNAGGALVPQVSALDTIISLPAVERSVERKMAAICETVSRASDIPMVLGSYPTNSFIQSSDRQGATNQKARDVLVDTFESMTKESGPCLSWRLNYSPGYKRYVLNIHVVSKPKGR
jgi:Protein of unknown function (DUF1553)/Protein of unknown function (DUF1549)